MRLRTRALGADDLPGCWPLISNRYAYTTAMANAVPHAWRDLLAEKAMIGVVVEDRDRRDDEQVMAFGASVFVRHSRVKDALSDAAPHLPARVLASYQERGSPILKRSQIARANASAGLTLLIVHHGWKKESVSEADQSPFSKL